MKGDEKLERRKINGKLLEKVTAIYTKQEVLETKQEMVIDRLDKINGHIEDYPATKEKLDNVCTEVKDLKGKIDTINDDKIGKKLFITISAILGLLIMIFSIINLFDWSKVFGR
jgi:tetrahydromethanopterin S-methyltransferase subunit G